MTKNIDLARKESPLRLTYNDMIALESVFHQIDHKDDNQKYIEWLELFTLKHHFLNQDLKNYDYKDLNDEDIFNITNLDLFINQISDYARKNNYELNKMNDGDDCYYVICYNGIYYKVGVHIKQNSNNYIKRISKLDSTMVIDYKAVLENKKLIFKRK